MLYFIILVYLVICYLIADKVGRHKNIGFTWTLILCILTSPFIGYLVAAGGGLKDAKGCKWCGNKYNEAEYCGLCGKNDNGDLRPGFKPE